MGSSIAPKSFVRSGPQGASDAANPVTQVQPQAQLPNQVMPDFTAYGGQQATPGTPAPDPNAQDAGGGSMQDRIRALRGNLQVNQKPFYGAMF